MEAWPTRHDSLHHHHHLKSKSPSPPPAFQLPSQSSPTLPIEPLAGFPGALSLHNYRKSLSQAKDLFDGQEGKTLRRKNAASNLNQTTQAQMGTSYYNAYYHPFAASSTTSSPPPPLSPSYSPSALSEQLPELVEGYGYSLSPLLDGAHYESSKDGKQSPYKLLDTFRDRLEKFPDPDTPDVVEFHGHSRARSDSVLFKTRRARKPPTATVVHQGTSFEILNPHESLDFARIVSYIEDVDSHSASNHQRDSYLNGSDNCDVIEEEPDAYDASYDLNENEKAHDDLVGDSPHHPMPSISERLEEKDAESCYAPSVRPLSRPLSMVRPWTAHNETDHDLGEPGPPVCYEDPRAPPAFPVPLSSANTNIDPVDLAAIYDIGQSKGASNPTAIIYSDHPPLRKRSTIRKTRKTPPSSSSHNGWSSLSSSNTATTAPAPLKRLRGIAQSLRKKTFPRASLS
ncbi:hypothetical protein BJY04DRAFT_202740 [Aspergillus karnatakaensis]|uniref:oxidoreductase, short-chain dehydrogenase/reductase family n=1 Tax=Aspergillus karnatakaensis TaxID=1810916 RepID=UPI003CCD68B9